jgi:hypothetical protein
MQHTRSQTAGTDALSALVQVNRMLSRCSTQLLRKYCLHTCGASAAAGEPGACGAGAAAAGDGRNGPPRGPDAASTGRSSGQLVSERKGRAGRVT